jgi:hypothetical protein
VFSLWDRIHGSYRDVFRKGTVTIGIPGYSDKDDNTLMGSITAPFRSQKDYWAVVQ